MNRQQLENKKLFWKMVDYIEGCSDCIIKNHHGVVTERGMLLDDDYSILYGLDDGVIRIYDNNENVVFAFNENNAFLLTFKLIIDDLED